MTRLAGPRLVLATVVMALSSGLLAACAGDDGSRPDTGDPISRGPDSDQSAVGGQSPAQDPGTEAKSSEAETPAPAEGRLIAWEDYDEDRAVYAKSTVVLYFHAPWCHECQATDEAISTNGIPPGLVLVQIDYDSRTDLREEYGVTIQHSFVLVDDAGIRQDIWTETISGAEIAARAT